MAAIPTPRVTDTLDRDARDGRPGERPARPGHHRPDGFQNNHHEFRAKTLGELLKWRRNALRDHLPPPPREPIPVVEPDLAFLHSNGRAGSSMSPAVTWIGHATAMVQMAGLTLLTDPMFSDRASPLGFIGPRRHQPPGLSLGQLPHIDLVLISHNHYDHLDLPSVQALKRQPGGEPLFAVPLGVKAWLNARGVDRVVELDWWDTMQVSAPMGPVEVVFVPSQHWSGRGLRDIMKTLWGGFAVLGSDFHLFYAGDTAYSADFADLRERLSARQTPIRGGGFDLALLPIGAYEPRWLMSPQHVNVEEAIYIHRDIAAKRSLGIHWGTFSLSDEALDEPPRMLARQRQARALAEEEFFVLAIGQTCRLASREAPGPRQASPD